MARTHAPEISHGVFTITLVPSGQIEIRRSFNGNRKEGDVLAHCDSAEDGSYFTITPTDKAVPKGA